jgi:hypothetical protein
VTTDLAISAERDQWLRRLLDAERAAYLLGRADGYRDGYERGARLLEATWPTVIARLGGRAGAEVQAARWELRGEQRTRETFGRPHPDDYQGQDGAA